jgi:hypothetical protein
MYVYAQLFISYVPFAMVCAIINCLLNNLTLKFDQTMKSPINNNVMKVTPETRRQHYIRPLIYLAFQYFGIERTS